METKVNLQQALTKHKNFVKITTYRNTLSSSVIL